MTTRPDGLMVRQTPGLKRGQHSESMTGRRVLTSLEVGRRVVRAILLIKMEVWGPSSRVRRRRQKRTERHM